MTEAKCPKCNGEGQVADSADQEPWSAWANLPPGSDLAVRLGMVNPTATKIGCVCLATDTHLSSSAWSKRLLTAGLIAYLAARMPVRGS